MSFPERHNKPGVADVDGGASGLGATQMEPGSRAKAGFVKDPSSKMIATDLNFFLPEITMVLG